MGLRPQIALSSLEVSAQVCDVVVDDGGVADGEAGDVAVAQELGLEHARGAVVEGGQRRQVAEVVVVHAQHVEQQAAAAAPVLPSQDRDSVKSVTLSVMDNFLPCLAPSMRALL